MPNQWDQNGSQIITELQSITNEIDELTKAVLDTITLATLLKNSQRRIGTIPARSATIT
jgi:hypothetical protein